MRPFFSKVMTTWMTGLLLRNRETEENTEMRIVGDDDNYDIYMFSRGMYPDHDICDMYCRYLYR